MWFTGDVIANGIKFHYHRTGGDKPVLVIAHGFGDNGIYWTRVARALDTDYDVVMYDRRGHGLSDAPESGYSFEDHAADLVGLIAALDLARPRVIGHSGGAVTAATVAADYPELLACVVLEDPAWGSGWGDWEVLMTFMREWFLSLPKTREELIAHRRESHLNSPEQEVAFWADSKVQLHPNVVQTFDQPEPPWRDLMRRITCPILLITGDQENGAIITPEDCQAAADLWRDGKVVRIDGAGHIVHYDRYEPYVAAVKAFLAEVEAREHPRASSI